LLTRGIERVLLSIGVRRREDRSRFSGPTCQWRNGEARRPSRGMKGGAPRKLPPRLPSTPPAPVVPCCPRLQTLVPPFLLHRARVQVPLHPLLLDSREFPFHRVVVGWSRMQLQFDPGCTSRRRVRRRSVRCGLEAIW